jgi:membrane fusion protein (multidrug efflux system)
MTARSCTSDTCPRPSSDPQTPSPILVRLGLALAAALAMLAGCGKQAPQTAVEAPPPSVIAAAAKTEAVKDQATFVGRVAAVDKVALRARVQGFLKDKDFKEGQEVEVGELLFQIEPDQYASLVEQREADLAKAKADQLNTAAQLKRGRELLEQKNIAQAKVDELQAADSIALASIQQAEAALNAAKLDLSYTKISAPVAGRIGLSKYTVGNLVGPASDPLATIVSRDPIYVQFPLTQREVLDARRDIKAKGGNPKDVVVQVRLPDNSLYDQVGRLNFIDVTTDQGTDTVTLRAQLPNPNGVLVDGQYVGVLLQTGKPESAIVVPQSALQVDQQGVYVLIIDGEGKAQVRRIETGPSKGAMIVVKSGLEEGDLVIVEGVQKVRPGQAVSTSPPETFKAQDAPAGAGEGEKQ